MALGRLRSLSVKTERPAWLFSATQQGGSLLAEVLRVQGLRELRLDYYVGHALSFDYDDGGGDFEFVTPVGKLPEPPSGERGSVPAEAAPASLRTLHFRSANLGAQPHLEFLMRSHAATLAEVTLPWTLRKLDLQSAPSAAAFNAIPGLRRLDIPLPADLHLLDCPLLCELRLVGHGFNFGSIRNAEDFLRSAAGARLTSLTLCCWPPTAVNRLLSALAASGQARLTTLTLECPAEVTDPYSFKWPLLSRDLTVLAKLPSVRKVRLMHRGSRSLAPDALWHALASVHIPSLQVVETGRVDSPVHSPQCMHEFLHMEPFLDVLRTNPQLHFLVVSSFKGNNNTPGGGRQDEEYHCHQSLSGSYGKLVGICNHPVEEDAACGLEEHGDTSIYTWTCARSEEEVS